MVCYDTLIVGAGCWSAGAAVSGKGRVVVVDRGAVIGAEYFDTYRPTSGWQKEYRFALARELFRTMDDRAAIRAERTDCLNLAPFLYEVLKPCHRSFRLWTEIGQIRPDGDGFAVTLFDADGREEVHCSRLIDTTPECISNPAFGKKNITHTSLTAVAIAPAAAELMALWRPADASMRIGRTDDELFFTVPTLPSDTFPEARRKLVAAWNRRREIFLKNNKIAFIAKRREVRLAEDDAHFAANYAFFNSGRFENPLLAFDAGLSFGEE